MHANAIATDCIILASFNRNIWWILHGINSEYLNSEYSEDIDINVGDEWNKSWIKSPETSLLLEKLQALANYISFAACLVRLGQKVTNVSIIASEQRQEPGDKKHNPNIFILTPYTIYHPITPPHTHCVCFLVACLNFWPHVATYL